MLYLKAQKNKTTTKKFQHYYVTEWTTVESENEQHTCMTFTPIILIFLLFCTLLSSVYRGPV